MKRSNSSVPGAASGPSIEKLSESASMLNRIDSFTMDGCALSFRPVAADPVNVTTSWQLRCSNRSPTPPTINWRAPSGRIPDSIIERVTISVRKLVAVAGLTIAGIPARKVGASFSSIPQTGKLNALMWTATPSSGTQMCRPMKVPPLESGSRSPSTKNGSLGSSRRPLLA